MQTRQERVYLETARHRIAGTLTLARRRLPQPRVRRAQRLRARLHPAHRRHRRARRSTTVRAPTTTSWRSRATTSFRDPRSRGGSRGRGRVAEAAGPAAARRRCRPPRSARAHAPHPPRAIAVPSASREAPGAPARAPCGRPARDGRAAPSACPSARRSRRLAVDVRSRGRAARPGDIPAASARCAASDDGAAGRRARRSPRRPRRALGGLGRQRRGDVLERLAPRRRCRARTRRRRRRPSARQRSEADRTLAVRTRPACRTRRPMMPPSAVATA